MAISRLVIFLDDINIILSVLWVACMLCYLLGDVIRIFAGVFKVGEIEGKPVSLKMYLFIAIIMVIPIIMAILSLLLPFPLNGWINIGVAAFFILFNLAGIKGYKAFDIFLLIISFGINGLTIWYSVSNI